MVATYLAHAPMYRPQTFLFYPFDFLYSPSTRAKGHHGSLKTMCQRTDRLAFCLNEWIKNSVFTIISPDRILSGHTVIKTFPPSHSLWHMSRHKIWSGSRVQKINMNQFCDLPILDGAGRSDTKRRLSRCQCNDRRSKLEYIQPVNRLMPKLCKIDFHVTFNQQ